MAESTELIGAMPDPWLALNSADSLKKSEASDQTSVEHAIVFESQANLPQTGTAPAVKRKKGRQRIPEDRRMLLEATIDFGLSDNFAGQLVGIAASSRIYHEIKNMRKLEDLKLQEMSL